MQKLPFALHTRAHVHTQPPLKQYRKLKEAVRNLGGAQPLLPQITYQTVSWKQAPLAFTQEV